jgi:hypothetical protein
MTRIEFIEWLRRKTLFERESDNSDSGWRYLVDYADYVWDELYVEENEVSFSWEEKYWGGTNYRNEKYSFDEFVIKYKNDTLK